MRHDFSSQFLRIIPPETSFGDAWESLCTHLLCEEFGSASILRLRPPDRGIDILERNSPKAYQCKSTERGAFGTIDADKSCKSLATALKHRATLKWDSYCFATNADYTGAGIERILEEASGLGVDQKEIDFLGPEYWDRLCIQHENTIHDRFDYRLTASTDQVAEAFAKARYYDKYVKRHGDKVREANYSLVITNNRTPLEIEIPFSPELTVKNYLDVAKSFLGISLDWTNFNDLQTSSGPSVSVTIDQKSQPFKTKLKDLPIKSGDKLEIWFTVVWKDETRAAAVDEKETEFYKSTRRMVLLATHSRLSEFHDRAYFDLIKPRSREALSYSERRKLTVERGEANLQSMIWKAAREFQT